MHTIASRHDLEYRRRSWRETDSLELLQGDQKQFSFQISRRTRALDEALPSVWREIFDRFPLPDSPGYHAFRHWYGWEPVPMQRRLRIPPWKAADLHEGRVDLCEGRADLCEDMV